MEKQEVVERELMPQEEFEKYIKDNSGLRTFEAVGRYKSVRRAIKRNHVTGEGFLIPKRPFNNRANTSKKKKAHSRSTNEYKRNIYGQLIRYYKREAQ